MAEYKETVTTSKDQGVSETGAAVNQQTKQVNTEVAADSKTTLSNIVWYIVGFIEILLAFRFVLKILGANPNSGFVEFIYTVTGILTMPFDAIFGVAKTDGVEVTSVFEPSILVAAVVYLLIGWGIVKLMNIDRSAS